MSFRFCVFTVLFVLPFRIFAWSAIEPLKNPKSKDSESETLENQITVRESTTELQISVGESIFVFGKAKGTLDKVKVGMHVLPFSQSAGAEINQSTFSKVSWKRLKNGSIQIQSSYNPWPATLTWTVFANGDLKMEASAPPIHTAEVGWLGLGFNFPDRMLSQVSWKNGQSSSDPNSSIWKNSSFTPMADPALEMTVDVKGFFQPVQQVKLEFETVTVDIRSETSGVFLGLGHPENQDNTFPKINSDMAFLFNQQGSRSISLPQAPSEGSIVENTVSLNPLVLWFHFQ